MIMKRYLVLLLTVVVLSASGSLYAKDKLYFVFLNTNPDRKEISEEKVNDLHKKHLNNITRLSNKGVIIAAGPFDGGGGLFIIKAENLEDVNSYLYTDPAIAADRYLLEIFPINIYNGKLCDIPEDYEMVTYQFVRLRSNGKTAEEDGKAIHDNRMFMQHLQFETNELLVHAKFNDKNDGFLILNVADTVKANEIMNTHPSVIEGSILFETKPLWIAKGTFCED